MQGLRTWQLFALAVGVWGTTWHAILYQLPHNTPEVGVAIRFALAGALLLALCAWRGERLRFDAGGHLRFALQGLFLYSLSYVAVYHAERHVASGLVAVGYSASPLINAAGAWLLWRTPTGGMRFLLGGMLGIAGVVLIFWPELHAVRESPGEGSGVALGAGLTAAAVLLSSVGNLVAHANPARRLPLWPAMGYSMLYGAGFAAAIAQASGHPVNLPSAPSWWLSLVYLSVAGSMLAFGSFLTLQQRVGPGPASTVGVMTPLLAIVVSTLFEGYLPSAITIAGLALAVMGNVLMLQLSPAAARAAE